jgi:transposase
VGASHFNYARTQRGRTRQLAKRFKVSLSFVRNLARRYRETGTIEPKPHGGGAVAKLETKHLQIIKTLVDNQPDALLEELCERFTEQTTHLLIPILKTS